MTTSGTATFSMNFTECAEEAFERAGYEMRSGYDLRTARRSLNLMLIEWNNRGINMWTIDQGTVNLVTGTATYTLPADTVDLLEHVVRTGAGDETTQQDRTLARISVSTYAAIPNKLTEAPPLQILVNRLETPTFTVWPIPDDSQDYQLVYWRMRRIEDAGSGIYTPDIVYRFYPALVAGLAYYIAMKKPDAAMRLDMLKAEYENQFQLAADEDREKAPQRWVPMRSYIGRA
jgi:hypothetical protein